MNRPGRAVGRFRAGVCGGSFATTLSQAVYMANPVGTTRSRGKSESSEVLELSWEFFGELCRVLAVKVATSGYTPDIVIGIAKAGVIPGAVVASILRCDFYSLKISRDDGMERVREQPKIFSQAPKEARGKKVLIVDEISTSGETLRMAANALRQIAPSQIRTAASLVKVGGFRPDFYALETDAMVIFPWDRHVVDENGAIEVNPVYRGIL
jgi:hypoxanthine phosphoribosyltransferase